LQLRRKFRSHIRASESAGWLIVSCLAAALTALLLNVPARPEQPGLETNRTSPRGDVAISLQEQHQPGAPDLPDIPTLISACDRNGAEMHQRLTEYTYLQKRTTREAGRRGKLTEQVDVYEAYPVAVRSGHNHVVSLISVNGVPVSPSQLELERRRAAEEMESIERAGRGADEKAGGREEQRRYISAAIGLTADGEGIMFGVSQFLRQCEFSSPRRERFAGRDVYVLSFRPRPGVQFTREEKYISKLVGSVWIDAADQVVWQLLAWQPDERERGDGSPDAPRAAAIVSYEQTRLPEGIWVPRQIRVNAIGRAAVFNGVSKDMTFEFSDYKRFRTEVKEVKLAPPEPRP